MKNTVKKWMIFNVLVIYGFLLFLAIHSNNWPQLEIFVDDSNNKKTILHDFIQWKQLKI